MYKVEIGGLVVHVDSVAELREVIRNFSETNNVQQNPATAANAANNETIVVEDSDGVPPPPKDLPRGARYAPTKVKVRSGSTPEALRKLFKGLDNATHTDALRFLATKGEKGASVEEIKEALHLPDKYKLGGLTAAIRRRAPHYGLDPEQVLIVEYRGVVANVRILDYRLGPEMLEMMLANGFTWKPKGGKEKEGKQG